MMLIRQPLKMKNGWRVNAENRSKAQKPLGFKGLSLNFLFFRFATHMDTEEAKKKGGWGVECGLLPGCNLLV